MATQKIFSSPPVRSARSAPAARLLFYFFDPPSFFPAPPGGSEKNRSYLKIFCAPEPADLTIPSGSTYGPPGRSGGGRRAGRRRRRSGPPGLVWCWLSVVWAGAGCGAVVLAVWWCWWLCAVRLFPLCWLRWCGWCVLRWLSACCAGGADCGFCMDGGLLLHGSWGDYRGVVNRPGIDMIPRA